MSDTKPTYPASLDIDGTRPKDIPAPWTTEPVCNWGDPEDCQDDNSLRASFAGMALKAYAEATNAIEEDSETVLDDLLNDLRHLCDALGLDFEALVERDGNYQAELRGEF